MTHDHDRAVSMGADVHADRAKHHPCEAAVTSGSHDQEVGIGRSVGEDLRGVALSRGPGDLHVTCSVNPGQSFVEN